MKCLDSELLRVKNIERHKVEGLGLEQVLRAEIDYLEAKFKAYRNIAEMYADKANMLKDQLRGAGLSVGA